MRIPINGWPLLVVTSSALIAMVIAVAALYGIDEEAVRVLIRATARTSLVFFCAAVTASALHLFSPGATSAWLRRNRRQLGLSFGVSHVIHYAAVAMVAQIDPEQFFGDEGRSFASPVVITGGLALVAMMATSFDRAVRLLGPRLWKSIHVFGVYFFWGAFAIAFGSLALEEPSYILSMVLLLATLALRIAAFRARKLESRASKPSR